MKKLDYRNLRTALVYDRVNKWGGAERLLLTLHEMFPNAPLFTSVYSEKKAPWAKVFPKVYTSFLQKVPFLKNRHEILGTFMPIVFESFDFSSYDLVVTVTSEGANGIITKPSTKHICICLTPTRYLWSAHDFYFRNPILRILSRPAVLYLRAWDKIAASRVDQFVAISTEVKNRIKKYYERDSVVIYPPTHLSSSKKQQKNKDRKYYLVVSRLVPYKRVDIVIDVFNKLGFPLVVIGTGNAEFGLKLRAHRNIRFVGNVDESQLSTYYKGAKALIMPQEEDFGLVAVEAQALGTPVIAYRKGGVVDTVVNGKTGILFNSQTQDSLANAVRRFETTKFDEKILWKNSQKFTKENFTDGLIKEIDGMNK